MARQNRAAVDDIAAGVAEPDAKVVRRRFVADVHGTLADPPLDGNAVLDMIPLIPDAATRAGTGALAREWLASNERLQRDACQAYDEYQLRRIASPRRDPELWSRTASRIAELHAESERALLPIAAFMIAAMPLEQGKIAQSKVDALISAGRSRSERQVDSIDPHFSSIRIDPTSEGIRIGKQVDIKDTQQSRQQDRREDPTPRIQQPPAGKAP
jgi:hypothetical protein